MPISPIDLLDLDSQEVASSKLDANRLLDYLELAQAVQSRDQGPMYRGSVRFPDPLPLKARVYGNRPLMDYDPYDPQADYSPRTVSRPGRRSQTMFPLDTPPTLTQPLLELSDARRFSLLPNTRRGSVVGHPYKGPDYFQYTRKDVNGKDHFVVNPSWRLWYLDRSTAIPCIRRRTRRSVLFAKRKAGQMGNTRNRRWTKSSYFIC